MADTGTNEGPLVAGLLAFTLGLGGIFVFARVMCRSVIKPQFGWDDAFIVIAWLTILGYNTAIWVAISNGYGKHITALTLEQATYSLRAEVVGEVLAVCSFPPGKASVAYLLLLIFPGQKLRWLVWSFVAANAIFFYINAILILVQCQPVAYQWDRTIPGGTCWNPKVIVDWGFLTGVTGAFTDFLFAFLPWFYISRLKMNRKEKFFVGLALSTGFFAGICSILKIYYTSTLAATADYAFNTIPLVLWGAAELSAINVAACIPTLRPLILWLTGKTPRARSAGASGYEGGYGQSPGHGRFPRRSQGATPLASSEYHDSHIYQLQSYDVSVSDRKDELSDSTRAETGIGPTVTVGHAF